MDWFTIALFTLVLAPFYGWILVRVASTAFFAAKWNYHRRMFRQLDNTFKTSPSE